MTESRRGIGWLPDICVQFGITRAVITPGSRNAPLIIAFANYPGIECFSITDERSAAYFAMGMAQQLNQPVALICTSGTAVLNFSPAIAEAYYQKIPLLVITADRPHELIGQNEGQTIKQRDIFANYTKKSFELPVDSSGDTDLWFTGRIISEAINHTLLGGSGPVHLNVPLREPLYTPVPQPENHAPVIRVVENKRMLDDFQWQALSKEWKKHKKKLVLCGFNRKNHTLNELLETMARNNEVVVIAENLSNLSGDQFIESPDSFVAGMSKQEKDEFLPDLVVTIGGAITSKHLKTYIRDFKCPEHWHIDENDLFIDTFTILRKNIRINPVDFFMQLKGVGDPNKSFVDLAGRVYSGTQNLHNGFLKTAMFSDITAFKSIFRALPGNINLHLANSTTVRYAQLFRTNPDTIYNSNRGTSGIDGCVSTAAGAAMVNNRLTVLLTGDLAFIYDSNGLWNSRLPDNLRVIVINNNEGNIFKLIETSPEIEGIRDYIETPHNVNLKALTTAYGLDYFFSHDEKSLSEILSYFFEPKSKAAVLEIKTSGEVSEKMFKSYYKLISKNYEQ